MSTNKKVNPKVVQVAQPQKEQPLNGDHNPNGIKKVDFKPNDGMIMFDYIKPPKEGVTKGGIVIPESLQKSFILKAIVVAVGDDVKNEVGDLIALMPAPDHWVLFEHRNYKFFLCYNNMIFGKYTDVKYTEEEEYPVESSILQLETPGLILPFSNIQGEA